MNNIEFCAIAPTAFLENIKGRKIHLVLAHLVETDDAYAEFYLQESNNGSEIILDNSAFEMYKQGKPMYSSSKLVEMGNKVKADYIVMSDYPGEASQVTIDKSRELIPAFKSAGFKTFFVPQSRIGDVDDYMLGWRYALNNPDIDLIGLSILGAPNAYGVESTDKLQRYLSRTHVLSELDRLGLLEGADNKIHCLGMLDGPNELKLLNPYKKYIKSIDSSSPIWAGICGIQYDNSPTGLIRGKNEIEVDFNNKVVENKYSMSNLAVIDKILSW